MARDSVEGKDKVRVFLALPLAHVFFEEVRPLHEVCKKIPGVKWVKPEQLHVTLHFFGDVSREEIAQIKKIIQATIGTMEPFQLFLENVGYFPPAGRPRIIWLGLGGETLRLAGLQGRLEKKFSEVGFPIEDRTFQAHATIGRIKNPGEISSALSERLHFQHSGTKSVDHLCLYQSLLSSEGPRYEVLEIFPLR